MACKYDFIKAAMGINRRLSYHYEASICPYKQVYQELDTI